MDLGTLIQNEDFYAISQVAIASNAILSDNEVNEYDDIGDEEEEDGVLITQEHEVPSTFTSMEETNTNIDGNWIVSQSRNTNDITRELGKDYFKDKEELIRAVKLHSIRTHKQFVVDETRPTKWSINCKLKLQSGCKWHLRACKQESGYFEITTYTGPHTCLHDTISQDHPNLDASLIAHEIKHLIKEQPSIVEYCATWAPEFSPLPHEAYWPQSSFKELLPNFELLRNKKGRPRSTRLRNEMDTKERKKANLCGICRQSGHNRKGCPSRPR